jgi:serine/threonine protein kinase
LLQRIGAGGMGVVYLGTDGDFTVAVKTINPALAEDKSVVERFRREIETLGRLDSEYVSRLRGSDLNGDLKWMAVEYINSPDLKSVIDKNGEFSDERFWTVAKSLLQSLCDIHKAGVVHRDIKPENILYADKTLKIIDFGIAQEMDATSVTTAGVSGSTSWLSPEQIDGMNVAAPSDVFSAGATLYFVATGQNPWTSDNATTGVVFNRILQSSPDLSGMSENKRSLIKKMLEKKPGMRGTATSLLTLAQRLEVGDKSAEVVAKNTTKRLELKPILAGAVAAILAAAASLFFVNQASKASYICAETIYVSEDLSSAQFSKLDALDFTDSISSECQSTTKSEQLFDVESCVYMTSTTIPFGTLKSRAVSETASESKSKKWNQRSDRYGCRTFVQLGKFSAEDSQKQLLGYNQRLSADVSVSSEGSRSFVISSDGQAGAFVTRFEARQQATEPFYLFAPEFPPIGIQLTWIDGQKPLWASEDSISGSFTVDGMNVVSDFCWADSKIAELDKEDKSMRYQQTEDGETWTDVDSPFRDESCGVGLTKRLVTLPAKIFSIDMKLDSCMPFSLYVPETLGEPATRMAFCVVAGHPKA